MVKWNAITQTIHNNTIIIIYWIVHKVQNWTTIKRDSKWWKADIQETHKHQEIANVHWRYVNFIVGWHQTNWCWTPIKHIWTGSPPTGDQGETTNCRVNLLLQSRTIKRLGTRLLIDTASSLNLKTSVITFVNAHTISHYLQTPVLSLNRTLSIARMLFRDIY